VSCAILIVDMQNDFVSRGGYYDRREMGEASTTLEVPSQPRPFEVRATALTQVLGRISDVVDRARLEGWPIVFLLAAYGHAFARKPRFLLGPGNAGRLHYACKPETWGSRLVDPISALLYRPARVTNEVVLYKHTLDGFCGTGLRDFLLSRGVRTVGVAGVETHACVLSTAISTGLQQFESVILEDCTWTAKPELGESALRLFAEAFGRTTQSARFCCE
jgi:nicotinamidase-related amidase